MDINQRQIGIFGTASRITVGFLFLSPALYGRFQLYEYFIALILVPAIFIAFQRFRISRNQAPLRATGFWGFCINAAIFLAFYLTPNYFPPLAFTSDVALIFYGASMLVAAVRGYAGCEVMAISNWLLGRDDQVGCVFFSPIDFVERNVQRAIR
jgi:hypothetical protein